jgi:hypothetical protein
LKHNATSIKNYRTPPLGAIRFLLLNQRKGFLSLATEWWFGRNIAWKKSA